MNQGVVGILIIKEVLSLLKLFQIKLRNNEFAVMNVLFHTDIFNYLRLQR